jgi:hypothetical protein
MRVVEGNASHRSSAVGATEATEARVERRDGATQMTIPWCVPTPRAELAEPGRTLTCNQRSLR